MSINIQALSGKDSDFEKVNAGKDTGLTLQIGESTRTKSTSAISVDLKSSLINNDAYGKSARTMADVMTEAQNTDAKTRHNFMSVLANTLSPEDYAKASEEGFDMSETGSEETVTIIDKIKASLAMAGEEIIGFTDDISTEKLAKITGSAGLAGEIKDALHKNDIPVTKGNVEDIMDVVSKLSEITSLSDGAVKYMTLNDVEPTFDNIYKALHITNGQNARARGFYAEETAGYYAQKADALNFSEIEEQVDKVIVEAGFDADDETIKDEAKWMIEESIPLTPENLKKVVELKEIELPLSQEGIVNKAAVSIANKSSAMAAGAEGEKNNIEKAIEIKRNTERITDKDLENVVRKNREVTLRNLFEERGTTKTTEEIPDNTKLSEKTSEEIPDNAKLLESRKNLEEIRFSMTVSANLRLMNKGIAIDVMPIKDLIGELNKAIEELGKSLFEDFENENAVSQSVSITASVTSYSEKYRLFEEATFKVTSLKTLPADVIGKEGLDSDSLDDIYNEASSIKIKYEKAEKTYEAIGTAPRSDMGDSIKKAFRNVDDILKDLNLETSEENRRAVRILGYNKMEITTENIEKIRTMDEKLVRITNKLKPEAVLKMIKDGHNPLKMTLDQLSNELSQQNKDNSKREEKYSKFLYKLEKNNEITPAQKESYIGIYRLFHRLQVTDNAAIGTVLSMGSEMTIGNLLTASRTANKAKSGIDVTVDDNVGEVTQGQQAGKSISAQIESAFLYYEEKAEIVYENLEPEKLQKADPDEDTLLDELAEKLLNAGTDEEAKEAEKAYYEEQVRQIRTTVERQDSKALSDELIRNDVAVNVSDLEALLEIKSSRRGRNTLWDKLESKAHLAFRETQQDMLDELYSSENYSEDYAEHLEELSAGLDEILIEEADSYIDVKAIHLMQKQISVMSKMSDKGSFEVPVEIDGRYVSMNVTLKNSAGDGNKVEASVDTMDYGHISMAMTIEERTLRGVFASSQGSSDYLTEYMEKIRENFISAIRPIMPNINMDIQNMGIMYRMSNAADAVSEGENGISDSRDLLRMASIFVHAL